eukprot:TRINITY_DN5339_c0_g3_i1.p1 TRINITY_DN5339_c0_g3~~TRINITY_DN5339_c0_g3_i1.p1  ORF type:complete len:429 (-),score=120.77 TRINITY_DN5339_c0_g3_i1:15-1301(-)
MNSLDEPNRSPTVPVNIIAEDNIKGNLKVPKVEVPSSLFHTLTYLTFGILFVVIAFLIFGDEAHSDISSSIRKDFSFYTVSFNEIKDKQTFIKWLKEFTTYTYVNSVENNKSLSLGHANNFISDLRLVQRRMKLKQGRSVFKGKAWRVWPTKGFGMDSSKNSHEETSQFPELSDGERDLCSDTQNNPCVYSSGHYLSGYTYWIPMFKRNSDAVSTFELSTDILTKKWLDNQTRSVIVDFVLFNPYVEVYTYGKITLEFTETSVINTDLDFMHIRKSYYKGSGVPLFRAICEAVFVVFLFMYVIWQPVLMFRTYRIVKSYLEDKELSRAKYKKIFIEKMNVVKREKIGKLICKKVKLLLLALYTHFTNIWNLLNLTCIVLSVIICIYWLMFIGHYNSFDVTPDILNLSLIHICRCRRYAVCRSRWSPYH